MGILLSADYEVLGVGVLFRVNHAPSGENVVYRDVEWIMGADNCDLHIRLIWM